MSTAEREKRLDELKWKLSHPTEIKSMGVSSRRNQRAEVAEKEVGLQAGLKWVSTSTAYPIAPDERRNLPAPYCGRPMVLGYKLLLRRR